MKWFYNLKIGARLITGFAIVALITGIIGVTGIINMKMISNNGDSMYKENLVPLSPLNQIASDFQRVQVNLRDIVLDNKDFDKYENEIKRLNENITNNLSEYQKGISSKEESDELTNLKGYFEKYNEFETNCIRLSRENKDIEAFGFLQDNNQLAQDTDGSIAKLFKMKTDQAASKSTDDKSMSNMCTVVFAILMLVGIVLAVGLGLFISRSVSKPVKKLMDAADKLSVGDVNVSIEASTEDEIGSLMASFSRMIENIREKAEVANEIAVGNLDVDVKVKSEKDVLSKSMKKVVETLRSLIGEMDHMSKQHIQGDIDAVIPEEKFQGAYGTMAKEANDSVKLHVNNILKILSIITSYAEGDFTPVLERLPGKQVIANEKLDLLRKNIIDVNSEINKLIIASKEGKLSERANPNAFQGDWAEMINGLNGLMDVILVPINESMQVLSKMAFNDYTMEMTGQYKGKLKEFAETINHVHTRLLSVQEVFESLGKGDSSRLEEFERVGKRSENDRMVPAIISAMRSIQELIHEAEMLATAAMNGDLRVRGNENKFEGGYKEIIAGMNRTMEAVARPIQEASSVMQEMSKGNLTVSMDDDYKGEYAKIKEDLNHTIKSFNDVLNDINNAAHQVASGARQVSDSAQALSQGSTEQASAIEELTASIEEIAAQTRQNAVNAGQANELALSAKDDATEGNEQMKEMLKSMIDINEASSNISKIIKVIDEIAFQTNILALNAAVEAARAGQHGKGFAVVAEEVRNLAARSANAAKETTVLIEGSIQKVQDGTKIANETAEALNKIVEGVAKATSLVGEIASASNEQASGIAQVNQGIQQISQVVQTNSATSEESAAASEELSSQAEVLREMVGEFSLKKGGSTINNLNELNPEVLAMLEDMSSRKKKSQRVDQPKAEAAAARSRKIALSDKEFGKY